MTNPTNAPYGYDAPAKKPTMDWKTSFDEWMTQHFKLMASIPQAAFAACKLNGYNEKEMTISKVRMNSEMPDMRNNLANKKLLEYSPVKYNSKLMNSIWGLYNRYSPHNIKGNEYEAENRGFKKQQPLAVASYAIDKNLSMAHKSGNEWNFP